MKNSAKMSSRESTINNEDRIINRDLIDPYKYEKRLLKVYDYDSNKNKHNLNLNSLAIDNSNSINLPQKNSGIQNFNRIKDYMEQEKNKASYINYKYNENFKAENTNLNLNKINNMENSRKNFEFDKNEELKNPSSNNMINDYNYQNHLKVFNSLSNFSDSNNKTFNLNDSKLTFNSRIDNSQTLNKDNNNRINFLTNLNSSNSNLNANLQTYDENLNKYKRRYLNTTDSRESSANKNTYERNFIKNNNDNINNKNKSGLLAEKNDYIKINESTEIPSLNRNEKNYPKGILTKIQIEKNNFKEMPLSNYLMGINTTKLHKTIENDMKEYDNMSKIMKDQIGNYNSKLNQMSKNIGNTNSSIEKSNIPLGENINRKDFSEKNRNKSDLCINNYDNINNSRENLNYKNENFNKLISSTERNHKNKNDFDDDNDNNKGNYRNYSTNIEIKNYANYINEYSKLNRITPRGAYEKYNFDADKNYIRNNIGYSAKENNGLNYDYSNKALTINTIGNTDNSNIEDSKIIKIDDLEKNIYNLKNRIENNLKNRENKLEKSNNLSSLKKPDFSLLNKTIESNLNIVETDKNNNALSNNTTNKNNIINTSAEESLKKANLIENYLDKYKDNLNQEKVKSNPNDVLAAKDIWQQQHNLKIEKLKDKHANHPIGTEENMEFHKDERRKVLDMIKDCKKEIEYYKQKITHENQDFNSFPEFGIKNKNTKEINSIITDNHLKLNIPTNNNASKNNKIENENINNEIKLPEGCHKANFTLGRQQDFTYNNYDSNNNNSNHNLSGKYQIAFKRPNSKSADRYTDSKINELSINETYMTNIKKNNQNDYSSNINLTLESASNHSLLDKNKAKSNNKNQNSSNKEAGSKSKISNSKNKAFPIKNNKSEKSPIRILNTIASSKNGNTPLRDNSNLNSKSKLATAKKANNINNNNNNNKRSNTLTTKKLFPKQTDQSIKDKHISKPKDLNSIKNNNNNATYLSTITNNNNKNINRKVILDKLSNIDDISSLEENLQHVQMQKREILQQENEILKEKIKHLELKIEQLVKEKQINSNEKEKNADEIIENNNNNFVMELQIWKNRSEKMTQNYISTLSDLRNQLNKDKKHYVDLIQNMQGEFHSEVDRLKKAYEGNINRNEKIIKKLKKENEDIIKKLGKVKDIIALGQNNKK